MKRHGNLFEKITAFDNLLLAAKKAMRGKKDKRRVAAFHINLENEILAIKAELEAKTYKPRPLRTFWIAEPKVRKIGASDFRDRVVHHAVCNIIEPIFENGYIYHSYACRKGKGTHRAIRQAKLFTHKYRYFLKCDIRKYFESVDHQVLKEMLREKFKDPELLWLLDLTIVSSGGGKGIPIGSLTSQHFANFYLDKLDHHIKDGLGVKGYLRYMDDFILFGNDKADLHALKANISVFLTERLQLSLKEKATLIAPCNEGIPFLGFRIFPGLIRINQANKRRMIVKLKLRRYEFQKGLINEKEYVQSLMSMTEHLKNADTHALRRRIFDTP